MEYRLSEYSPTERKWMIEKDNVMCGTMIHTHGEETPSERWISKRRITLDIELERKGKMELETAVSLLHDVITIVDGLIGEPASRVNPLDELHDSAFKPFAALL
ncbi:hypothetical protein TNCV_3651221 [Trichonephila clavipes]|nr:hypothetical protein TNCV_3651221 [Trichonephila clavipes]